jgi:hypothetical protein
MYKYLVLFFFLTSFFSAHSHENDTILLMNNHVIIGEIKIMENGTLTMETDYSDKDFIIEWDHVKSLNTSTESIITLRDETRLLGSISRDANNEEYIIIFPSEGSKLFARPLDIVYIKPIESNFLDRMSGSIGGGLSITKANNTQQFSLNGNVSYLYTKLSSDIYTNILLNVTQDTIKTNRSNIGTNWRVFYYKKWFIHGAGDFLQSDEQNLRLRTTVQLGTGSFWFRTHKMYLSSSAGFALNSEAFTTDSSPTTQSMELFGELEFNAFAVKDLSLTSKIQYYPSLSQKGRNRINFKFDAKVDLPLDFYIGGNISLNFDSKPTESASRLDYVINNSVGWKF